MNTSFFAQAVPAVISMILTSCIVIVDGFFIGRTLGAAGLSAVNLTVPILYIFLGLTIMTGVGGSVLSLHRLGAGDRENAGRLFSGTMLLIVVQAIVLVIVIAVFRDGILRLLGAGGEGVYGYTKQYLSTMLWFYLFQMINIGFTIFIRSGGKPMLALGFGLAGNLLNVLLDWMFIVVLKGGLIGAAAASGISVLIPMLCATAYCLTGRFVFRFRKPVLTKREIASIFGNGSSEMVSQLSFGITTFLFNMVIMTRLGVPGVAAFTIVGYVTLLQSMVMTGLGIGLAPIVGYGWGAGDTAAIRKTLKTALIAAAAVGAGTWAAAFLAGGGIAEAFSGKDGGLADTARKGFTFLSFAFLLSGLNIVASSFFTSIGDAKRSAVISLLRSLVLVGVFVIVLPPFVGDAGIWLSIPLTEVCTLLYTVPNLAGRLRRLGAAPAFS